MIFLSVIGLWSRSCARKTVHEFVGNTAHVLTGIFFGQQFLNLRLHVLRPNLQSPSLFLGKPSQHLDRIPSLIPDFVQAMFREILDHGIFRSV